MKKKITIIVTYYNEEKTISKTFDNIINQSYLPNEIIFINSGSTDDSNRILNKKIQSCKKRINCRNYKVDTNLPSTSKNLGVQLSKNSILAFMDCDLKFDNFWLEKKIKFFEKYKKLDAVISTCKLSGSNKFDISCVANTYGINTQVPCIPGSLIKKNLFNNLGLFIPSRSFYDVEWKKKLFQSKNKFKIDYFNSINYNSINYAKNEFSLFIKSINYICDKVNLYKNYQIIFYLFSTITFFTIFFFKPFYSIPIIIFYIFFRILLAFKKSKEKTFFKNIYNYFFLIRSFIVIDIARVFGSIISFINFFKLNSVIAFLFIIIILFNSPFPYIFERHLSFANVSNKNNFDSLVIFSGDGNILYSNDEYKLRALRALEILKTSNVKKIVLSSGRENLIADVEIIKNFFISRGIDEQKIFIFKKYPSSTYENVKLVGEYLLENKFKEIIFITKNIHNKRSLLIWKKNFPQINLYLSSNHLKFKWRYSLNEVLSISYEYLAIVHNFFVGRL